MVNKKAEAKPNKVPDQRPVVHVNSNEYFFNITNQAEFKDVIFDGIN